MNRAALRALGRVLRGRPYHGRRRRPVQREAPRHTLDGNHEQWVRDMLPSTPPAPPVMAEAWPPRITRWVRLAFPLADDTVILAAIRLPALMP